MIINARHTYWTPGYTKENCLHRVSSRVRGEEVSEYLGWNFNTKREEGEVCIFLKPRHLKHVKDGDYVDVMDDLDVLPLLKDRPKVNVISMSEAHDKHLRSILPNKITLIYHHHINFERGKRVKNKKLVGGMIGSPSKAAYAIVKKIKDRLKEIDVDFTTCFNFKTRKDMIDYFKSIDFLVIWWYDFFDRKTFYRHPTKVINAASFGIPTLSHRIDGYSEMEGFYIPIETLDDIVREVEKLKDDKCYNEWQEKLINEAEKYHISKTTKEYRKL